MAKRTTRQNPREEAPSSIGPLFPSAQSLFRLHLLGPSPRNLLVEALAQASPHFRARDQATIDRIQAAVTAEEVLDLAADARGLADHVWYERLQALGPEIAPLIADRLKGVREIQDRSTRSTVYEHLLGALGPCGDAGIEASLACYDALSDYAKSLACVVLGRLGAHGSSDTLWDFYQSVKGHAHQNFFIGPLWGLVDLGDPRAADALGELLWSQRYFYECFAMAYKAGDARVVIPLMYAFLEGGEALQDFAAWALVSVAHRIGREALLAEIQTIGPDTGVSLEQRDIITDVILGLPQPSADTFFSLYFHGFSPDMLAPDDTSAGVDALELLRPFLEERGLLGPEPPSPAHRPSRNDPCWCGSGQKYKHCHWRQDRQQAHRETPS